MPLVMHELVIRRILSLEKAIAKMTINPARILRINKGVLKEGSSADITIIDPKKGLKLTLINSNPKPEIHHSTD